MPAVDPSKIRNVVFVAHPGAGKTSLIETILFAAKATSRLGRVPEGTTITDYLPEEIERKTSISLKVATLQTQGYRLFLIDTPGYADFIGETISGIQAADGAVVVVDAVAGVSVGTERVWGLLEEQGIPRIIVVNRLDKEQANYEEALKGIEATLGKACAPLTWPIGLGTTFKGVVPLLDEAAVKTLGHPNVEKVRTNLLEAIAESDEKLLEAYLDGRPLDPELLASVLRQDTLNHQIIPVLCGSAWGDGFGSLLLQAITVYLPSPADRESWKGTSPKDQSPVSLEPKAEAPFSALVFKTIADPYVGQLTLFRVASGSLKSNTSFFNATRRTKERFGPLYHLFGKEQRPVEDVGPGEIGAVAKLKETFTGDTICVETRPVLFQGFSFPESAISHSIKPKSRGDEDKIMGVLQKLSAEDPTFTFSRDPQTNELIISGMGDLHLAIMVDRMKRRFHIEVEVGTPKVPYRETITRRAKAQGKYKKQTGGHGQYGDTWVEVEPLPRGSGFQFESKIVGGAIPRQYIPSVEKGIRDAIRGGILAGYPLTDLKVTLVDGSYHEVDSSDLAFQIAGSLAIKKAEEEAGPVLVEPIMLVEVTSPPECMGQITGDLNSRRGRIQGIEPKGKLEWVKASVPLAEMFTYAPDLRSMTGGRGSYTMHFDHYDVVPAKVSQAIIAKAQASRREPVAVK